MRLVRYERQLSGMQRQIEALDLGKQTTLAPFLLRAALDQLEPAHAELIPRLARAE